MNLPLKHCWQSVRTSCSCQTTDAADRIYPESQCGFRSGRSTFDMIFSVRQLQEKCREQQQPLYLACIDLTKAFEPISRTGLFKLLEKIWCPPKLLSITASFHVNMHGTVNFDGEISEPFKMDSGVELCPGSHTFWDFLLLDTYLCLWYDKT